MKTNLELVLKNQNSLLAKNPVKYNPRTRRWESYEMLKKEAENSAQNDTQNGENM